MLELTANWQGPLALGSLPEDKNTVAHLRAPGVYIYVQSYPGIKVVYAGKHNNVLMRILDHCSNFIGLAYDIRNAKGGKYYHPIASKRCAALNTVEEYIQPAIDDAKRLRFYYCLLDALSLKPVESILIDHLKLISKPGGPVECDNYRRAGYGDSPDIRLLNKFTRGCSELKNIIGTQPLTRHR